MNESQIILVNEFDEVLGTMEKMETHYKALLHRAISVFVFNSKGEWLLQRRNIDKYHSRGLWSNTCCGHTFPNEPNINAAHSRLKEEMGMQCDLKEIFSFQYKEQLDNKLTENELDHAFCEITDQLPLVDPNEVMEWRYISFKVLFFLMFCWK